MQHYAANGRSIIYLARGSGVNIKAVSLALRSISAFTPDIRIASGDGKLGWLDHAVYF